MLCCSHLIRKGQFFLFDCATGSEEPIICRARTIVLSSPREKGNYKNFRKEKHPKRFFVPPWMKEVLEAINTSKEDIGPKFKIWGGIPNTVILL